LVLPDTPATADLPPQARSGATRTLLVALLRAATGGAPMVVRLEDLHWADSLSLDLLAALAQDGPPLLLLATHRPFGLPAPPFLATLPPHPALALSELDPAAATDLVLTRAPDLPAATVAAIVERGQGHPFFLEELIRMYEETGTLDLSPTVGGVIQARIDRLAEAARLTLRVAGVLGRVFSPRDLAAIYPVPLSATALAAHLADLAGFGLTLLERADPPQYTFKHAITQEIAYGNLLHTQRRNLHAAAGDWYCRVAADDVALIAYHYDQAAAWDRALPYLLRAAESARLAYANQEAVRLYSRVLEVAPPDDSVTQFTALLGRVEVWEWLGDRPAQWADLLRLEALAPNLDLRQQAQIAVQTARYHEAVGNYAEQGIAVEWAVAVATVADDYESLLEAYFCANRACYMQRQIDAACAAALRGFWLAHQQQDRTGLARFLMALGGIAEHRAHYRQAGRLFARSRRLYQQAGHRLGMTILGTRQASLLTVAGDYPAAQVLYTEALAFYRRIGERHRTAALLKDLGDVTYLLGDYEQATRYLSEARVLFHAMADWIHEIICLLLLTDMAVDQNRPAAGLPLIHEALALVERWPDSHIAGYVAACQGRLDVALGDLAHAADRFAFVLALPLAATEVSVRAPALAGQAWVALAQGDPALAARAVTACLSALTSVQGDQPLEIYDSCYTVLAALGDATTAQRVCAAAYARLQAAAARISDPSRRAAFLSRVPVNRRVAAAAQASGVAPPSSPPAR
ncbi:MAG: tetratricopeptide repeat protein, partial [Chloroflexota bacterium]|nr:tetratricopeptide repeat protein [Chloroflexota bacterium]